jgi:hypothetical protein
MSPSGMRRRTVTMHFPAKDDLLFADDGYFGADL